MNQGFSYYFCIMIELRRIRIGARAGSGSGSPKNMWIPGSATLLVTLSL
jgi:hypothetical protein